MSCIVYISPYVLARQPPRCVLFTGSMTAAAMHELLSCHLMHNLAILLLLQARQRQRRLQSHQAGSDAGGAVLHAAALPAKEPARQRATPAAGQR